MKEIAAKRQKFKSGGVQRDLSTVKLLLVLLHMKAVESNHTAQKAMDEFRNALTPDAPVVGGVIVGAEPLSLEEFKRHLPAQRAVMLYHQQQEAEAGGEVD